MVGTASTRPGWVLKARGVLVAVAAAAVAAGGLAAAATPPSISIHVSPVVHSYGYPAVIYGRLSTGRAGVSVTLEERQWPFAQPFHAVDSKLTGKYGGYSFHHRSPIAAEYRVAETGKALHSAIRTVYTEIDFAPRYCHFIHNGYDYGCGVTTKPTVAGTYTLEFSYYFYYPASVFAQEKNKPVYVYYGQRDGSRQPPSTLYLRKTVPQHPQAQGDKTEVHGSLKVTIPSGQWENQYTLCTQSSYSTDGFGLPGPPGSHHCGAASITYAQSQHWLG